MSPAIGYRCRFYLPLLSVCCRWAARLDCRPCAPGAAPFPSAFPCRPRAPPVPPCGAAPVARFARSKGRRKRQPPPRPPRPPYPRHPLRGPRLCRDSPPHSLNRPRGFTPGRSKLWERRPFLAASLTSSTKSFRACRAFPCPFRALSGILPIPFLCTCVP